MRGREPCVDVRLDFCGITPAYAGKSESYGLPALPRWDHPRVCGEERKRKKLTGWQRGSPPRMRGRVCRLWQVGLHRRITPAYAGKRSSPGWTWVVTMDHPRVCGEEFGRLKASLGLSGSPPRMRGRVRSLKSLTGAFRITPAYAGKRLKKFHSIGHFSCILCLFHSVLHRASASGGSRAGPCAPPCLPAQNAIPV